VGLNNIKQVKLFPKRGEKMTKRILFTGGGSAGHVTVNLALISHFIQLGWDVKYFGSAKGIEADLIKKVEQVEYIEIATGKLRRYFSWENVKDPFRVIKGVLQAYKKIKLIKPDVIFSKGGFVSVPVVIAAWMNKVPVVIHESDITPGLANKIAAPFATTICYTFPETKQHLSDTKSIHVGAIVREELKTGSAMKGLNLCDFIQNKTVLLVMGGSQGSQRINQMLRDQIKPLVKEYQIVHICGKGQIDHEIKVRGYKQFEYIHQELADIMAMTDIVVSRAGSNSIYEFLSLRKPMLLIPLPKSASRGDQILNAESFEKRGLCEMLYEENLTAQSFVDSIHKTYSRRQGIQENMKSNVQEDSLVKVIGIIKATVG
jgi:UDP-N-acetylglucosamine--N-acetylmuramyl-(pentapeptide) pyrophosphoryl-undecaprenol N-acetylglucosamine transferase